MRTHSVGRQREFAPLRTSSTEGIYLLLINAPPQGSPAFLKGENRHSYTASCQDQDQDQHQPFSGRPASCSWLRASNDPLGTWQLLQDLGAVTA